MTLALVDPQLVSCFCTCFSLLGLKLLFGSKPVTLGSVLLLACVSGSVATAWVGGTGSMIEQSVAKLANASKGSVVDLFVENVWAKLEVLEGEEPEADSL